MGETKTDLMNMRKVNTNLKEQNRNAQGKKYKENLRNQTQRNKPIWQDLLYNNTGD